MNLDVLCTKSTKYEVLKYTSSVNGSCYNPKKLNFLIINSIYFWLSKRLISQFMTNRKKKLLRCTHKPRTLRFHTLWSFFYLYKKFTHSLSIYNPALCGADFSPLNPPQSARFMCRYLYAFLWLSY